MKGQDACFTFSDVKAETNKVGWYWDWDTSLESVSILGIIVFDFTSCSILILSKSGLQSTLFQFKQ